MPNVQHSFPTLNKSLWGTWSVWMDESQTKNIIWAEQTHVYTVHYIIYYKTHE